MKSIRAAIVGATGYAGAELVRLLSAHPVVQIVAATSSRAAGERVDAHCPWLKTDLELSAFDVNTLDCDVVFLAQESGFASGVAPQLVSRGIRVIDLSADFRLRDDDAYESYYGKKRAPHSFAVAYGLCELADHSAIRSAALVANPGCYPTATCLALAPFAQAGLVEGVPVIDAKSGVSGAGRSRSDTGSMFSERDGSFAPYAVTGHRHIPEIEQSLGIPIRFTPHLIPVPRGMSVTTHVSLNGKISVADAIHILRDRYQGSRFVRVVENVPETKHVLGSNRCDIYADVDSHTNYLVLVSVLDNLVKGAAGQAIQNMNLMFDLEEALGLPVHGVWP